MPIFFVTPCDPLDLLSDPHLTKIIPITDIELDI